MQASGTDGRLHRGSPWRTRNLGPTTCVAFLVGAIVWGCSSRVAYSPPQPPPAEETVTVPGSFDQGWQAVVQTFFHRNIPIRTIEKESGVIESDEVRGEIGVDCDCGTYLGIPVGGYGGAYGGDAYYRYRVLVRGGAADTVIHLRSSCRARVASIEGELVCRVTPAREAELRQAITDRAAAPAAPSQAPRTGS